MYDDDGQYFAEQNNTIGGRVDALLFQQSMYVCIGH